jgi:TetR/AcrR family transcriptional regulator, transcriptional repressor for nem operon
MRYPPEQKVKTHEKIVKDASRRLRAEGLTGAAVSAVMRDAGLTHGGFYKHFKSKDELVIESLRKAFRELAESLARAAQKSEPGTAWKAPATGWKVIVKAYLSPEHCDHPEWGCPLAALAPELARADKAMKAQILAEMEKYQSRMLPFMPGRGAADKQRAFMAMISTMLGALAIARILPDEAQRARVLTNTRDFLLRSF